MDRTQLQLVLEKEGIPEQWYSLSGGLTDDSLCLDEAHGRWVVYIAERGKRKIERWFSTEDEACMYFLNRARFYFGK